jgi:anaerobic selenocysteine-containing dehydrogenase
MPKEQSKDQAAPSRRGFFMGAAAAGAAVAAVTALPGVNAPEAAVKALPPAPENGGGYSLSEHVKRYYQTARV